MKKLLVLIQPTYTAHWTTDLLLAIPRIVGCYFLAVNFGGSKCPTPDWFVADVASYGFPFPVFFAWAAVLSEVVGGAMLVLGIGTRFAGLMVACTMLVAIFCQKWGGEVWEMLPAMGFLWIALYAIVMGSGRFGLDHLLFRSLTQAKTSPTALPNTTLPSLT